MDESSLVAAAFPFFFGAAAFPLGTAAFGVVSFGAVASFLGSGAAFGCVAARRLRSGFAVDAAAVSVALALLLLLLGDTVAPVTGAPRCVGLSSSSLLLSSSSDSLAALAKAVD